MVLKKQWAYWRLSSGDLLGRSVFWKLTHISATKLVDPPAGSPKKDNEAEQANSVNELPSFMLVVVAPFNINSNHMFRIREKLQTKE